jgi:hypothetical protein
MQKKKKWFVVLVVLLPLVAAPASKAPRNFGLAQPTLATAADDDFDMPVKQEETIRQEYPLAAAADHIVDIDNVWGSIDVVGTNSNQVQVVIHKTIRAESQAALEQAKKEVTLQAMRDDTSVRLYVDGPFRCHNSNSDDGCCCNWRRDRTGYLVKMDFQIQVPNRIRLALKTVNEGNIKVQGVAGDFSIRNVNGKIDVEDAAGSGRVRTVNGGVKVSFRSNPTTNSEFTTVNGEIELSFAQSLSADFRFKTFNGEIYSDYELSLLPARQPEQERKGSKFIFRSDRYTNGRVGTGGPEIKIDTLNGDIRVLQRHAAI